MAMAMREGRSAMKWQQSCTRGLVIIRMDEVRRRTRLGLEDSLWRKDFIVKFPV